MLNRFTETYKRLLRNTKYKHHRYIYKDFNMNNRLTGLIGPRGTGKTTLLLQYINEQIENKDECIYVSVDNIYFSKNLLIDFVDESVEIHGIKYFFFDEIHKYKNWNQEIKNIYDSYPDIKIVFSGSSSINLVKGTHDLSRRGVVFRLEGLSFREYLLFNNIAEVDAVSFDEIVQNRKKIEEATAGIKRIKGHFREYTGNGYYPFFLEDRKTYHQKILNIIEKTIYEDILEYYRLKTENLSHFKRILSFLATIPPGELNRHSIAKNMGLDSKTIQKFLTILKEAGLAELVSENRSGSAILKQTEKMYLDNPDLYEAIIQEIGYQSNVGTVREIFFIRMLKNSGHKIFYSKTGDFAVENFIFEIGGKSKTRKQIMRNPKNAFLVKDNILYGNRFEIPLHLFGFLY